MPLQVTAKPLVLCCRLGRVQTNSWVASDSVFCQITLDFAVTAQCASVCGRAGLQGVLHADALAACESVDCAWGQSE